MIRYCKNGVWLSEAPWAPFEWPADESTSRAELMPAITLGGGVEIGVNLGSSPFHHLLEGHVGCAKILACSIAPL